MKCLYSGNASQDVWDRINAVKPSQTRDALYAMGCSLQNLEWQLLKLLEDAEIASKKKHSR